MKKTSGLLATLVLALSAAQADAMNLGALRVASARGQPFRGYVEVIASVAESERPLTATVLRDLFSPTAMDVGAFAAQVLREGSRTYVRIASPLPVEVASFSLRLQVAHDGGAVTSRYGITLSALAPPVAKVHSIRRARRAASTLHAGDYGPVKPGETLWSIAKHVGATDVTAFMDQVLIANPDAFAGGDRNRLKIGAILHLPGSTAKPVARASSTEPVAASASTGEAAVARPARGGSDAAAAATPMDPQFTAMISAFDAKLAAIRAKYGEAATTPAAPNTAPAAIDAAPLIAVPTSVAASAAPAAGSAAKITPPAVPKPTSRVRPAAPQTPWWQTLPVAEVALGALVLGVLAGVFRTARHAAATKQRERALRLDSSLEEHRRADVARKAENRVKLESEVRQMLTKKTETPAAESTGAPAGEADRGPLDAPIAQQLTGADRLLAIDANIAHGRYVDAERLLHQVIGESPRNFAAKLRLVEVYYITEQVGGFVDVARDLLDQHRGDISNDDWQRVMRMGKIIAPDAAPFSGVRGIHAAPKAG